MKYTLHSFFFLAFFTSRGETLDHDLCELPLTSRFRRIYTLDLKTAAAEDRRLASVFNPGSFLRLKKRLSVVLRRPRLRRAWLKHHVMASVEHAPVLTRPLSTVIDIGANRGQFALAAREFSGARLFSFEPLALPAKVFLKVFEGDSNVKFFMAAVGPVATRGIMHVSARDDSSSLLAIGRVQSEIFPGTHEVGTVEVTVAPLDTYVSTKDIIPPAMLKLDVQGFELQALQGCHHALPGLDYVYCECSFIELYEGQHLAADVMAYLQGHGFALQGLYNVLYDTRGNCVQADLLFGKTGV